MWHQSDLRVSRLERAWKHLERQTPRDGSGPVPVRRYMAALIAYCELLRSDVVVAGIVEEAGTAVPESLVKLRQAIVGRRAALRSIAVDVLDFIDGAAAEAQLPPSLGSLLDQLRRMTDSPDASLSSLRSVVIATVNELRRGERLAGCEAFHDAVNLRLKTDGPDVDGQLWAVQRDLLASPVLGSVLYVAVHRKADIVPIWDVEYTEIWERVMISHAMKQLSGLERGEWSFEFEVGFQHYLNQLHEHLVLRILTGGSRGQVLDRYCEWVTKFERSTAVRLGTRGPDEKGTNRDEIRLRDHAASYLHLHGFEPQVEEFTGSGRADVVVRGGEVAAVEVKVIRTGDKVSVAESRLTSGLQQAAAYAVSVSDSVAWLLVYWMPERPFDFEPWATVGGVKVRVLVVDLGGSPHRRSSRRALKVAWRDARCRMSGLAAKTGL